MSETLTHHEIYFQDHRFTVSRPRGARFWRWSMRPPYGDFVYTCYSTGEYAKRDAEAHFLALQDAVR